MNWQEILDRVREYLQGVAVTYGPVAIKALLTLAIGTIIARMIRGVIRKLMGRAKVDPTLIGFSANMVYMMLMAFIIISVLGRLGLETGSFVAIIGATGLALGLALQGSLSNFAAGVMIIMFRPFKAGDFVEAGGATGTIEEILVFSTVLKTPDNRRVIVPNGALMGGTITNYNVNGTRRVDMVVGIGYDDDIRKAKQILEDILASDERVLKDPAPSVTLKELADSSIDFNLRPWVNASDYGGVYSAVTEAVKFEFDKAGISIPYPQQDVHIHQATAA